MSDRLVIREWHVETLVPGNLRCLSLEWNTGIPFRVWMLLALASTVAGGDFEKVWVCEDYR